ncbi:MAG: hydrogenase maturation protease [Coriobacteriales bacterium]|nr:hydrogenase maturation protease [Coriobacteriales bacterium]
MIASQRILILCIGNILLLDEGFGPQVAEQLLAQYSLPPQVTVLDRGVLGMAILADLRQADQVLIIDALDNTGQAAGTIMSFKPEDLANHQVFHGAHDIQIVDVLHAAALLGVNPEVSCLGVQIENLSPESFQIGLTPAVQAAVPLMVELIVAWLAERGVQLK